MSERYDSQCSFYIPGIALAWVGEALSQALLVGPHNLQGWSNCGLFEATTSYLHALPQDHEGLVDVTRLLESVTGGLSMLRPFRPGQINEGES